MQSSTPLRNSQTLAGRSLTCQPLDVAVDTAEFRPGGTVAVTLTCTVQLSDLGPVGFGATKQLHGHAVAVVIVTAAKKSVPSQVTVRIQFRGIGIVDKTGERSNR